MLGGAALDGFGDVLLGLVGGGLARLRIEPLEQVGGVVPGVGLDLLEQQLLGFVRRQAGDALELVLLLGDQLLVLGRGGFGLLSRGPRRPSRGPAVLFRRARRRPGAR